MALGSLLAGALLVITPGGAGASSHAAKSVVLSTETTSAYGTILVSGNALYALTPSKTACTATCLKYWPELTLPKGVKAAAAGKGVAASKIGVVNRPGGVRQVTYGGKPLYYFSGDAKPGDVKGNVDDTWGKWSSIVLSSKGSGSGATTTTNTTTTTAKGSGGATTTTTSPGGGGVGF
jgi:predicted lipoprotein with Yx(FWY)xxD motif